MSTPVVRLHDVVALLGRFPALAGVNLDVGPGEVVLLKGPNGAGKTSLLRLCAGLLRPTSGEATVLGHDLFTNARAVRPRVGLLGHKTGLYNDLTVLENVTFWAKAVGVDESTSGGSEASARSALARVGVADRLLDQAVAKLSAGQRRRTSIASMVVRRPELWLLDEPHAGLDQAGRDIVDSLIGDAAHAGATVILASHELERVERLDPRHVTIAGGIDQQQEPDHRHEGGSA